MAGTTARCAASLVGVNFKTAAYYYHRLRELIAHHQEQEAFSAFEGEIEVDERYLEKLVRGNVAGAQEEKHQYLAC